MKLYELILDDSEYADSGVFALSLVQNPAIEANWVYFSKEGKQQIQFATIDNDKRTIVAPVLIPDKQILRIDEETGEEYRVYFTKDTVEKLAQKYLQNGYQSKATLEHAEVIDGEVTVVESWVSKSTTKDKSALYFNRAFPEGTWFVTMRVNDEQLWQDYVKTGLVKAISLEGIFDHKLVKASKVDNILDKDVTELTEDEATIVLSKIKEIILEAQPSVASTYPGEAASGSIAPTLLVEAPNLDVYGYETKYFQICPGAQKTFAEIVSFPHNEETIGMVRSAAVVADAIFKIENDVLEAKKATPQQLREAILLVEDYKDIIHEIDEESGVISDVSYMDGHIKTIESFL